MRIEESLNVTFDDSLPKHKSSPLVEDDKVNELVVQDPIRSLSLEVNASRVGLSLIIAVKVGLRSPRRLQVIGIKGENDDSEDEEEYRGMRCKS
ncbi:hypothetical protein Tco_0282994 [Tanacetum coccineum]|uniref:Uncharacterized protein n=1 Tax=Tanacetum coccineum TaxID=301880 RepID=A0ABQ4XLH0_9ASTR